MNTVRFHGGEPAVFNMTHFKNQVITTVFDVALGDL